MNNIDQYAVGFQTEVFPFLPIDGVGHQSLSLRKTLSVLSSLQIATLSRSSCLSSFSFSKKFSTIYLVFLFCFSSTRNRYFLFYYYVKCIFVFFSCLWDVFPTIHLSSKENSRVSLNSYRLWAQTATFSQIQDV